MELIFLAIFFWPEFWDRSLFSSLAPEWRIYWDNAYMRGAVSGLGIVNVYIAPVEIFRLALCPPLSRPQSVPVK
ncbi:MAG TPA: hypothetical protein VN924_02035 [Bryobacteraceae bacterium]|jgi:hypothetical protein|nr:hypothetical protein [Bryobacteraceae bacterium]